MGITADLNRAAWRGRLHFLLICSRFATTLMLSFFVASCLVEAGEPTPDNCGKNETKTEQGCAKNPQIVHKTEPEYPKEARKHRVEGSVTLSARVTVDGTVDEIKTRNVEATDEHFSSSLEEAAAAALRKWRYRPATIEGKPVPFYFEVTIDFKLSR